MVGNMEGGKGWEVVGRKGRGRKGGKGEKGKDGQTLHQSATPI